MTIHCQQCTARNSSLYSNCVRCGAPLHIFAPPVGNIDDPFPHAESLEEHLLERISALEIEASRLRQQNERLLELMHRQATTTFNDHALLDALIGVLEDRGSVRRTQIEHRFRKLIEQYAEEVDERQRIDARKQEILDAFDGTEGARFGLLVDDGIDMLADGNPRRGIRKLQKAQSLDPANQPLSLFLGEYHFFNGRRSQARQYLERSVALDPGNAIAVMMLGVVCTDAGEAESAKEYFTRALALRQDSFVAHYGLGRLLAAEGRYREALSHLKRALTLSPSAEMHYLVGRTYLEDGRVVSAERHLRKAIVLDPFFDPALYHLGLIYLDRSDVNRAREYFRAASEVRPEERRYQTALTAKNSKSLSALPVFDGMGGEQNPSLSDGDERFSSLVMQFLAIDAFGPGSTVRE